MPASVPSSPLTVHPRCTAAALDQPDVVAEREDLREQLLQHSGLEAQRIDEVMATIGTVPPAPLEPPEPPKRSEPAAPGACPDLSLLRLGPGEGVLVAPGGVTQSYGSSTTSASLISASVRRRGRGARSRSTPWEEAGWGRGRRKPKLVTRTAPDLSPRSSRRRSQRDAT